MMNKRMKLAIISSVILLAAVIGWQFFTLFQHHGLVGVKVLVVPEDSSLKIDGKIVKPGRVYLTKGSHQLMALRLYFDNDTRSVNTADITKNEVIYMLPKANSVDAKAYLIQHPAVQREREAAGGAESERVRALLLKKYPLLSKLPQENLHYKIDYSIDSNQNLSLIITTFGVINGPADYTQYVLQTKQYKQEALDFLKHNGVSPDTFHITYIPDL